MPIAPDELSDLESDGEAGVAQPVQAEPNGVHDDVDEPGLILIADDVDHERPPAGYWDKGAGAPVGWDAVVGPLAGSCFLL